ncbi:MAG: acyltransferase, partial [Burkholderiales bacterium]|nr:acyltransferase [Burkholderiales bacterium]
MSLLTFTNIIPPLFVTAIALISARLMVRDTSATDSHQFSSIDGLRGYLALFVFIHHSGFWFNYSKTKSWVIGDSLYLSFGHTSVCLFFMLSGFLFGYKLLEAREKPIDWLKLFCSRLLRLSPLYMCLLTAVLITISIESKFIINDDSATLINNITDWILFTATGHPDINGYTNTHLLVAGVIWTLPYEWYFYFSLPFIGLLIGSKSTPNSGIWLILSCACIIGFSSWHFDSTLLWGFLAGGIVAYIVKTSWLSELFKTKNSNWILLAGIIISYTVFDNGTFYTRLLILTTCMAFIACGSNLFGILDCRAAKALSTVSYGVYLLHGLVLHIVFMHVFNESTRNNFSSDQQWLVIFICTPI